MKNNKNIVKRILLDESISGFDSLSVNSAVNGKDKRITVGAIWKYKEKAKNRFIKQRKTTKEVVVTSSILIQISLELILYKIIFGEIMSSEGDSLTVATTCETNTLSE